MDVHRIHAVLVAHRPGTAAHGFRVDKSRSTWRTARQDHERCGVVACCHTSRFGQGGSESIKDRASQPITRHGPRRNRRWWTRVDNAVLWNSDFNRVEKAAVCGDLRIDQRLNAISDRRLKRGRTQVHRAARLGPGALKIQCQMGAFYSGGNAKWNRIGSSAVVIEITCCTPTSVIEIANSSLNSFACVGDDR